MSDTFTMTIPYEVKWKRVADLLCCAFEGGSNYWYLIEDRRRPDQFEIPEEGFPHLDYPINPGGALLLSDAKVFDVGDDAIIHRKWIGREELLEGLKVMSQKYPRHFSDWLKENDDADTGDVFLQCVMFGDILYG